MSDDVKAATERLQDLRECTWIDFENASPECVRDMWTLASAYLALTAPAFVRRCVEAGAELPLMRTSDADFEAVRQSGSLDALKVAAQRNVEIIDAAVDRLAAELAGDDQTKRIANND